MARLNTGTHTQTHKRTHIYIRVWKIWMGGSKLSRVRWPNRPHKLSKALDENTCDLAIFLYLNLHEKLFAGKFEQFGNLLRNGQD